MSSPPLPFSPPGPGTAPAPTRLQLSPWGLNLLVAAYLLLALNGGLWAAIFRVFAKDPVALVAFGTSVSLLLLALMAFVTLPRLQRPALALMILTAAVAEHFRAAYGVLIDRDMIQNAMLTTTTESKHLFTLQFFRDIGLWGVLPAALIFGLPLKPVRWRSLIWRWPLGVALMLGLLLAMVVGNYRSFAPAVRNHREMLAAFQPGAPLRAMVRYGLLRFATADITAAPHGRDARPGPLLQAAPKPVLFVLFVGETARAQNFGLNGYGRDTTPELAKLDVVNFTDTASCGTSTAVSVPCMFSDLGTEGYTQKRFLGRENLVDILAHAGLKVEWIDNNTGDQQVAKRLGPVTRIDATLDPAACAGGECTDAAFLPIIKARMQTITENTVLVLHMIGSHGPAYYLRYPADQAVFKPDCRSSAFADCQPGEIVNAYDNSIRMTDHVLAGTIRMMAAQDRVIPALYFVSDHGESLGEKGLYLHAAPMFMAPDEQRKVPFVIWLSQAFQDAMQVPQSCLAAQSGAAVSQDNLFHSVLGLLDIRTSVRKDALDLSHDCRKGGA
ncbi:phosphoethanolamine transferase [Rhodobacter capsulatus]|uniref:phosphoethanolamine transferase n=1 Tax=Rhodobacter capsulatus TaxID=1061 RepID=UPI0006DD3505|nr:sulfatase-like hydrolase/transferase [Rhodobacter capsulatus]KQB15282.1 phosphoethanolamine transferase [Rhodobacter capsulatus]KQB16091.1 phosphoethanolamine transferase [Rhodobacter capsulatus]PZX25598.1 lipid A ethanolaminephosphotransferase [Rhodobacter capsulatus]QNR63905.1 phosphoethanolamine transferase [Rhodobacter capsulatus]